MPAPRTNRSIYELLDMVNKAEYDAALKHVQNTYGPFERMTVNPDRNFLEKQDILDEQSMSGGANGMWGRAAKGSQPEFSKYLLDLAAKDLIRYNRNK